MISSVKQKREAGPNNTGASRRKRNLYWDNITKDWKHIVLYQPLKWTRVVWGTKGQLAELY